MSKHSGFDVRLVWRDDGHLGDAALTCFVDGEETILPPQAAAHLDGCDACTARLGDLALVATQARELFAARVPAAEVAPVASTQVAPAMAVAPGAVAPGAVAVAVTPLAVAPVADQPVAVAPAPDVAAVAAAARVAAVPPVAAAAPAAPAAPPSSKAVPSPRPQVRVPFWAVAAAFVFAGLGAAPAALDAMRAMPGWLIAVTRTLPVVMQSVGVVVRHGSAALMPALAVAAVGSLIMVFFAASLARRMSRRAPLEGGV